MGPALTTSWPALAAARAHDGRARVPFVVRSGQGLVLAGAVARRHLALLEHWPEALRVDDQAVTLALGDPADRSAFLAQANAALRQQGAIMGWRDETFVLLALHQDGRLPDPAHDGLATMERAAARFWGSATLGAHCNGHVPETDGRPGRLWIARRSDHKPTDPGLLDNLVGGGVPHGQTPAEAVRREAWEEAGLRPADLRGLRPGRVVRVLRDIPEGLQREWLCVYDLALPPGLQPVNQDGEVQSLKCMGMAEALRCAAQGEMTVDAALATLDFALRHGLLPEAERHRLGSALAALCCGTSPLEPG